MLDVPIDFTSPISLEMPSFIREPTPPHLNAHAPIKDISTTISELQHQLQQIQQQQQQGGGGGGGGGAAAAFTNSF